MSIVARLATALSIAIALLILAASLADLHCTAIRPGDATFVLACRASRLEAPRSLSLIAARGLFGWQLR